MLLLLYPALRRLGYGMDLRSLAVVQWAGLRGFVGVAMALTVRLDSDMPGQDFK